MAQHGLGSPKWLGANRGIASPFRVGGVREGGSFGFLVQAEATVHEKGAENYKILYWVLRFLPEWLRVRLPPKT